MGKYREGQREVYCVFVGLKKAYDRVLGEEMWYCTRKSRVAEKHVRVVWQMNEGNKTMVRFVVGVTDGLKTGIGLHQAILVCSGDGQVGT